MKIINASIVQGSGIGPPYVVGASGLLHLVHPGNVLAKYADDMYLLIGASRRGTVEDELRSVDKWATINNMRLNQVKLCELLVHRPRSGSAMPALIPGVQRVQMLKILGVACGSIHMLHRMWMLPSQLAPGLCTP